jgi:alkylation response protein AidB-like acyl-CoA dehydrogenase
MDLLERLPAPPPQSDEDCRFLDAMDQALARVDPEQVERDEKIPESVIEDLRRIGAFGIRIPKEYGGLGLGQRTYNEAVARAGSRVGSLAALLSAHQSIGVPKPLMMFGNDEQKRTYLPRVAAGAISAFALTEQNVGSDPARIEATADDHEDGHNYVLNGEKLWCTNGAIADLLVVMVRTPDRDGSGRRPISAVIVETACPGIHVTHRCSFMGLKGIENAVIRFDNVRVPKANLLVGEGKGLRIALQTLNTGRLTLPAMCARASEWCLGVARRFSAERVQWGAAVGRHEAVGGMLAELAINAFATRAVSDLATEMAESGALDIRIEAALAKLYTSEVAWRSADLAVQVRGGRGYETAESLAARGEEPVPLERLLRDLRINRIFEGSSEIMRLFIAREAMDPHVKAAGAIAVRGAPLSAKLVSAVRLTVHMKLWALELLAPRCRGYREFGPLAGQMRAAEKLSRRVARKMFWAMALNGPGLEHRQRLLGRIVDAAAETFAMVAAARLAHRMRGTGEEHSARQLAEAVCRRSAHRAEDLLARRAGSLDRAERVLSNAVLAGEHRWLEPETAQVA